MAKIDKKKFPEMVVSIDDKPDDIEIILEGYDVTYDTETDQLVAETVGVDSFLKNATVKYVVDIGGFKEVTSQGQKRWVKKINTPLTDILRVYGYAKREDIANKKSINIEVYTITANQTRSTESTNSLADGYVEGIWSNSFSMTRQKINATYVTKFIMEVLGASGIGQFITQVVAKGTAIYMMILNQPVPDPKAIASKLMGPVAAQVQNLIAMAAEQYVKFKPTIDQVLLVVDVLKQLQTDPGGALKRILVLLIELIPEETWKELGVWLFRGGA
jgi:hypothetical protein